MVLDNMSYAGQADTRAMTEMTISQASTASNNLDNESSKGQASRDKIQKVLSLYKYRDTIPWIYETLMGAMPNAQNNPSQTALYEAYTAGDADAVKAIPRRDRKQLLVTRMQISFAEDLDMAQFDIINLGQGPVSAEADPLMNDPRMAMYMESMQLMGNESGVEKSPGFVVVIEGYSPYHAISQLLDPSGVDNHPDEYGFVTRLMHLSDKADPNDPNQPLALYKNETEDHFVLTKGPVSSKDQDMPYGIGVQEESDTDPFGSRTTSVEKVTLLDPLTKEVISSYPKVDGMGREEIHRLSKKPV
ncbi:MAG: hypothetical protein GY809_05455, partial [Planctomycetes bacterium]|nr:hypothetical protein [Planctomycetota bacterium]